MDDMTLTEMVDWNCERFEAAESIESLATRAECLAIDKKDKQAYTLVAGALDRMRASYKKRLDELRLRA